MKVLIHIEVKDISPDYPLCAKSANWHRVAKLPEKTTLFGRWVNFVAQRGEQAMIEYWQGRREGGRRGIIEIVTEGP